MLYSTENVFHGLVKVEGDVAKVFKIVNKYCMVDYSGLLVRFCLLIDQTFHLKKKIVESLRGDK